MRFMSVRYLFFLLPLLFCCCKPRQSPVTPDPDFKFAYNARFDSVISMPANSVYSFIFYIDVTNGDITNNKLACSITGLPGNMTIAPTSLLVGHLLGGLFTFTTGDIPLGTDTLKFTINSPSTGMATHKLILKIVPPPDYAPALCGVYDSSYDYCAPLIYKHKSVVATDTAYGITITNLNNLGVDFTVKAKVSDVIRIPLQVFGAKKIYGSGTYSKDPMTGNTQYQIIMNDTLITGLDTQVCTAHIQHK